MKCCNSLRVLSGIAIFAMVVMCSPAGASVSLIAPPPLMPPQTLGGEGYKNVGGTLNIINGLPLGSTVDINAELGSGFFNITRSPGGTLGGEIEQYNGPLFLQMQGTGAMAGYVANKAMQTTDETHIAPRTISDPVQSFDTLMAGIQGQLPPGDPDFDLLRITAGNSFGLPSPGHTTLTELSPGGNWNVDSFFDITYRIDFVGHPGGPFGGMSGSTTGTIRMQLGQPVPEPSAIMLIGAAGALGLRRRR